MWKTLRSEYIYSSPWLTVRKDAVHTDNGIDIDDFYVLEYPIWVNVVAVTTDGKFVIERQYRHGIGLEVFEICAGTCDNNELPINAAKRELLEETGFAGGKWSLIGKYSPNPNSMNNWCYSYLADGVSKVQDSHPELTEDVIVFQVSQSELLEMMKSGKIVEGIMLAPLWQYFFNRIYNKF